MPAHHQEEWRAMAVRSLLCLVSGIGGWLLHEQHPNASLACYIIAYISGAWDLVAAVWHAAREKKFGTNFLMLLVAVGAASIGSWGEAVVLLFLFSASAAMESFAHGRTKREINALLHSAPKTARLLIGPEEREVPVAELTVGQIVRVRGGEQIPADLEVIHGESACDESTLTGEADPVNKAIGDMVFGGTINLWGVIEARVVQPASESAHQRIIRMIESAQHLKAPVQKFTDRFGTGYTALVISICLISFLTWWLIQGLPPLVSTAEVSSAFYRAMTLLVVMSPCALVLSVPSGILSAIAFGARHGVLFRGGAAIETLAGVSVVAMDKTGTLTEGNLSLFAVETLAGSETESLAAAASLAEYSNHPISRSITREAKRRGIFTTKPMNMENVSGKGIKGVLSGEQVALGSREFLMKEFPTYTASSLAVQPLNTTETWIGSPRFLARLLMKDRLRPEARALISELHEDGVATVMLTGDKSGAAEAMARESGIGKIFSQLKPEEKVQKIYELKTGGRLVAMIGDGVNDAPCLAAADVGVAMGARGSDAAIEQAEVVLMHDRLENFILARDLSKRTHKVIRQNLLISFGVMVIMVFTTLSWAQLPLSLGVASHEGSTVLVVMNSLRLLFARGKK